MFINNFNREAYDQLGSRWLGREAFYCYRANTLKKNLKKPTPNYFLNSIFQFIIVFAGPTEAGKLLTDVIHQHLERAIHIAQG